MNLLPMDSSVPPLWAAAYHAFSKVDEISDTSPPTHQGVDSTDTNGRKSGLTPLMLACSVGRLGIVKLIEKYLFDTSLEDEVTAQFEGVKRNCVNMQDGFSFQDDTSETYYTTLDEMSETYYTTLDEVLEITEHSTLCAKQPHGSYVHKLAGLVDGKPRLAMHLFQPTGPWWLYLCTVTEATTMGLFDGTISKFSSL
ncbi:hypothetical protein SERLA73DRAFT_154082 [Serpula lacrymans var. lacrymans S7.3]|uniref:Uncharacterized protein n=1 Tax=Serpula lacrymans var. lacrymans (strain S7.3) TaxID=936435 RepID=F8Q4T0_SERL3|nr:hypothetical protein SERLA73DRAFT_154082 [Serpula lacrymans var. lacrymans S7.3]